MESTPMALVDELAHDRFELFYRSRRVSHYETFASAESPEKLENLGMVFSC